MSVLQNVAKELGEHKRVYWEPVNPAVLPKYYDIVREPIFLGQIEDKLRTGRYRYAQVLCCSLDLAVADKGQILTFECT